MAVKTVRVDLAHRSYDILIGSGIIAHAGTELSKRCGQVRALLVSDENVAPIYLQQLAQSLSAAGIQSTDITLPAGEKTKSFEFLQQTVGAILDNRLERGDVVIALGGGVIGDLTGFAAAIARRGMKFMQVPTSLLAQVDSSVGGKTGINTGHGKNLVGAFHQPALVLADIGTLDTLSDREFAAGYAEVVKYGLIDDADFFEWLEEKCTSIFSNASESKALRIEAVERSCLAKARVVAADEFEDGTRALLNLGHTFGHALEGYCEYDAERLVHGEGVSIGMVLAHDFSAHMNLASPDDARRVERHLQSVGLPTKISQIPGELPSVEKLMAFISQDKKVSRSALTFILTKGIGQSFIAKDVPASEVEIFLQRQLSL